MLLQLRSRDGSHVQTRQHRSVFLALLLGDNRVVLLLGQLIVVNRAIDHWQRRRTNFKLNRLPEVLRVD
ncbi:MAG: hypothetical protein WDM79_14870 [Terricaulis sp.]